MRAWTKGFILVAMAGWLMGADTYPTEAWPSDATVQALDGTSDSTTGLPYIARGTNPTSTPPLQIQYHRRELRANTILAAANGLRVVKESTPLRIGVFPGDYVMNGARARFEGATDQAVSAVAGTYLVWVDAANALQIGAAWPADVSQFVPLAEVVVAAGSISSVADRRGWARTIIPQSGGSAVSGTDSAFFIVDQDNGGAGVSTEFRCNRGSTDDDAAIRWNEVDDRWELYLDTVNNLFAPAKALTWESSVATGTAPLIVASTTLCANLNADLVDGLSFTAPAAANGLAYSTSTSAVNFTAAAAAADVLYADGGGVPTWGAMGSTSGVQAYDADLDALAALATTGIAARTAANTWTTRTLTAGNSITITNGDGTTGNPTFSVSGTVANAVQVGSALGALSSIAVGSSNTVLAGNTGAAPGFRQIVNADISTSAAIAPAKLAPGSAGQVLRTKGGTVVWTGGGEIINDTEDPLTEDASDAVCTNWGALARFDYELPNPATVLGMRVHFVVLDTDGIRITTGGLPSVVIQIGGSTSTAETGYVQSTTSGDTLTLVAMQSGLSTYLWVALNYHGTWTVS